MAEDARRTMEELGRVIAELEAHVGDPLRRQQDSRLRLHGMTARTRAAAVIGCLFLGAIIAAAFLKDSDAQALLAVFGAIGLFVCVVAFLVSWAHDHAAAHIQDAKDAAKAARRFFTAVRTGRSDSAYVALAPGARTSGATQPLDLGKVPVSDEAQEISDAKTFKKYWKSVFTGPSGQTRSAQLVKARKVKDLPADVAVVEIKVRFTSYTSAMALVVGPLILMLIASKHTLTVRKLLLRRGGLWYLASGELSGPLDQLAGA